MNQSVFALGPDPAFWGGRRVFLTGHTGFKGGWLSLWLQSLGAEVTGYSLAPPTAPCLFDLAQVGRGMVSSHIADIRDLPALAAAIESAQPEIVFHLAAQPLVRESYSNPIETYAINVMGTVHLLESVRRAGGVRVVLNVTSDKCYSNQEWVWGYRESEPMGGYDPYSSSKGCSELVSAAYRSSFFNACAYAEHGVAVATARAGNVIGGGDWAKDRLIPDILAAFESGQPVRIRNPHAIRPWQHVLEPLRGYMVLAERLHQCGPNYAEAWNFGPTDEDSKPVGWIVGHMAALWGKGATWHIDAKEAPHEAAHLKLDISKARTRLNWHPKLSLRQAIGLVMDWSQARQSGADMRLHTLAQIQSYQAFTGE